MRTFAFFGAKYYGFFEIYNVSARTRGGGRVEPVRTFFGQRGGINFSRFCANVFYGRPLMNFFLILTNPLELYALVNANNAIFSILTKLINRKH